MFTRIGSAAYKGDLSNIIALASQLGDPHLQFKSVHVGGTNGKGSVSHMLAAVYQTAGYKTALFTSPHLYDFRERIRINGEMISEEAVIEFVKQIRPMIEEISPSFFEITAAMAFHFFAKEQVDIAIIEVGLGGRLDSTNIIRPELSVITNIGWDHMNILGDSLQAIAGEKAGIIKEGVPVVVGERQLETDAVFVQAAAEKGSELVFAADIYQPQSTQWRNDHLEVDVLHVPEKRVLGFSLDLAGIYQQKNLCTVLAAIDQLTKQGYYFVDLDVHYALTQVKGLTGLTGRWEVKSREPLVVLDVAHNESGIRQVMHHLDNIEYDQLHIVIGMVKDKEVSTVLSLLPKTARYYFTEAHIPRALPAKELQQAAAVHHLKGEVYENVDAAIEAATEAADPADLVLVCGSVFLVAEVQR